MVSFDGPMTVALRALLRCTKLRCGTSQPDDCDWNKVGTKSPASQAADRQSGGLSNRPSRRS